MDHAAQARNRLLDREHAGTGHDAFHIALRHQEQALAFEADHFGLDPAAAGQRHGAGGAHGQAQADRIPSPGRPRA
jgi:hypothetical protein